MRKSRNDDSGPKGANWMDTYGDMVTLILTFFVLLYSFSSVDSKKWERLVAALSGNKSVLMNEADIKELQYPQVDTSEPQPSVSSDEQDALNAYQAAMESSANLYAKIKGYVDLNNLSEDIMLSRTGDEIRVRFTNNVLFDLGKATIKPEAHEILNEIASAINTYGSSIEMIRIEGHTDNIPISNREFASNWELSTSRAVNVLRYLIEQDGLSPAMLSAVGYGEYHPFGDNSTEEGRRLNRRVDFVIDVTHIPENINN
ncbi:MAG: OmpA family protein [Clostridia bacterium]|nr:OmpA family protein [Clostridia bacterium]